MSETGIGASVKRVEDQRFLTGKGNYTDDINRPGQTYAYILRSPHAHARITSIDTSAAEAAPGVVAVFTGKDVAEAGIGVPSLDVISQPQGRPPIPASATSWPVKTATTPGALSASLVSIDVIRAWACGLRTIWA